MPRLARPHRRSIPAIARLFVAASLALGTAACGASGTPALVTAPPTGARAPAPRARPPVAADPPDPVEAPDENPGHAVVPSALDPAVFRDPRSMRPRALALLVTETQQLEALFRVTAAASPDRPQLERRLAEDYAELERAATALDAAPRAPASRDGHRRTAEKAREAAIRHYEALLAGSPGDPRIDEVRYFLAYERERGGDLAGARKEYLELVLRNSSSRYVPLAYLAFGEMFFAEGAADASRWELAKQAYEKVLASPPPANRAFAYAAYRLACVLVNEGDPDGAVGALDKAIEVTTTFAQLPGSAALHDEAEERRRALAPAEVPARDLSAPPI